jgi:hypothetical protein
MKKRSPFILFALLLMLLSSSNLMAESSPGIKDFAGKWQGKWDYLGGPAASFSLQKRLQWDASLDVQEVSGRLKIVYWEAACPELRIGEKSLNCEGLISSQDGQAILSIEGPVPQTGYQFKRKFKKIADGVIECTGGVGSNPATITMRRVN